MMWKNTFCFVVFLCFFDEYVKASKDDYDLRIDLFKNYDRTVVPVKQTGMRPVDVMFDLALRSISELNEKQQSLKTTVWVRLRWTDEFLTWNPQNYSGVDSINVDADTIWIPDLVLYNSADAKSKALIYKEIQTQVTINNNGEARWFSPLILTSECSVSLADFPFDNQSCPMVFGLWTYDSLRVNLTLVNNQGDLSSYLPNGIFVLERMPVTRDVLYFACCPGQPYVRLNYDIALKRKTVFYLVNFLFPGILLTIMSFFSFLLPPESGERIGLGITNLLALLFLMVMVSDAIPPTSVSVPVINQFLTTVIAVNAITLISSAIAVKFLFFDGDNLKAIPWAIRIFVNKHIGNILCMNRIESNCCTAKSDNLELSGAKLQGISYRNDEMSEATEVYPVETENPEVVESPADGQCYSRYSRKLDGVKDGLNMVVDKIKKMDASSDYKAEWRKTIKITDRVLFILLALVTIAAGIYMFASVPKFYVR